MDELMKSQIISSLVVIVIFAAALLLLPIQNQSKLIVISAAIAGIFVIMITLKTPTATFEDFFISIQSAFIAAVIIAGYYAVTGFSVSTAIIAAVSVIIVGFYAVFFISFTVKAVVKTKRNTNLKATIAIIVQIIFIDACMYGINLLKFEIL